MPLARRQRVGTSKFGSVEAATCGLISFDSQIAKAVQSLGMRAGIVLNVPREGHRAIWPDEPGGVDLTETLRLDRPFAAVRGRKQTL